MKLLDAALSISLLVPAALVVRAGMDDPVVQVTGGQIKGQPIAGGGTTFKGIPFAQPPVGDLRWRDPAPVNPWTGVRDASAFSPACTQESTGANKQEKPISKEDCLYLNVWTAEWPSKSPKAGDGMDLWRQLFRGFRRPRPFWTANRSSR